MSPLYDNVLPLNVPKVPQTLPECLVAGSIGGTRGRTEVYYSGHLPCLLRFGYDRNGKEYRCNQE
jgi:hypothetical protein